MTQRTYMNIVRFSTVRLIYFDTVDKTQTQTLNKKSKLFYYIYFKQACNC